MSIAQTSILAWAILTLIGVVMLLRVEGHHLH
jgi:hypothetical protein